MGAYFRPNDGKRTGDAVTFESLLLGHGLCRRNPSRTVLGRDICVSVRTYLYNFSHEEHRIRGAPLWAGTLEEGTRHNLSLSRNLATNC